MSDYYVEYTNMLG